jgi:hypothetical protein
MYRIRLVCTGVPEDAGPTAAADITDEFTHRPWHTRAVSTWDGSRLILETENDFDDTGLASMDEFGDAIAAYVTGLIDGGISIESITEF